MLESVTGSTAYKPNIFKSRVPVDQEIAVRSVFILADTRFRYWSIRQQREFADEEMFAQP